MKIAILDDDKSITELLESYLHRYDKENNLTSQVDIFFHPIQFLENYSGVYDLVLMDIEMPGLNGIETAKELRRIDSNVVLMFITNMAQYAVYGYEVEAIDYVVKPLSYGDFVMKMQKARRYIDRNKSKKIILHTKDGIVKVDVSNIQYIEVMKHYLIYHTSIGEFTIRGTMKEVEENLSDFNFSRCNHCYLVNLKYVEAINSNTLKVANYELSISRNKKIDFMNDFAKYVGGLS